MRILRNHSLILLFLSLALVPGCKRGSYPTVDSEKAVAMLVNIPNTVPRPQRLQIYSTGISGQREKLYQILADRRKERYLLYETSEPDKINELVSAMRAGAMSGVSDLSDNGISYHILFYNTDANSTSVFNYIFFLPAAKNEAAYLRPNSPTGFHCAANAVQEWLSINNIVKVER